MISAQGLTKFYGDRCAVSELDFTIEGGEIVGFLGLNGAGKTTTLRILACLLLPSRGTVRIHDLDVVDNPHEIRKLVGFLPETPPLYAEMTVDSYLRFVGRLRGLGGARLRERLAQVVQQTNLEEVRQQVIGSLSHGYRQRVGIAQAVIHDPPVLILDEPIQGLDPVQIVEMRELVRGLKGRHTILLSSHILSEIHQTCDRLMVLQNGALAAVGTERELTARLTGSQRLSLLVRGHTEPLLRLVRSAEHVQSCEAEGADHGAPAESGLVRLSVTSSQDIRELLSRRLVESGFGVLELGRAEAQLETVFLQLARGGEPTAFPAPPQA
ncbi:MAG: ABC transporter ATP-binding protein [Proteobacteria bacterium]|jgi:ABC-2 type transport system ATP-binding protein|nr:ABC transporter ATP-binding protein [Pseudomonadota bacterium]